MDVDYGKLSEQYASFLAALGGVSITVLTLVLTLGRKSQNREVFPFLVASLMVATFACFTGAHLMAETAAFVSKFHATATGERLFLLASVNIFLGVGVLLFALTLLPIEYWPEGESHSIKPIAGWGFALVFACTLCWMVLGVLKRFPGTYHWAILIVSIALGVGWCYALWSFLKPHLFSCTFVPILLFVAGALIYFTATFSNGGAAWESDVFFFCVAVTVSSSTLMYSGVKLLRGAS